MTLKGTWEPEDMSERENAIQALSSQMTIALGPVGELRVHVENAKQDINELWAALRTETELRISEDKGNASRIGSIELRAAGVAGGVTVLIMLGKFLLGK